MPSFRQAAYLEEAICSVLDQDHADKELIVMDGGSDDGSVAVIERHQARLGARFVRVPRYLWGLRLHPEAKMSGHNFAESAMARPDHPSWERRRRENRHLAERYGIGRREEQLGRAASRALRTLSGASARAWLDSARFRCRHWKECDFSP